MKSLSSGIFLFAATSLAPRIVLNVPGLITQSYEQISVNELESSQKTWPSERRVEKREVPPLSMVYLHTTLGGVILG